MILFKDNNERIPQGLAKYETAQWDRSRGNHRAVVRVQEESDIVCAYLPWRRRDAHPEAKHVLVIDARTDRVVGNVVVATCNREYGEILFQPVSGPGEYHLYYLVPEADRHGATWPRSSFPIIQYKRPQHRAEEAWLEKHGLTRQAMESTPLPTTVPGEKEIYPAPWRKLPLCELVAFQSRGERHSFYPMELIATLDELGEQEHRFRFAPFMLFPELRTRPIRMPDAIPHCWAVRDEAAMSRIRDRVMRNEYYVFQVGLYASKKLLKNVSVRCSDLKSGSGATIPAGQLTCFNLEGIDHRGQPFTKTVDVAYRRIQALWFGLDVARAATPGLYEGTLTVAAEGETPQSVQLSLTVEDKVIEDRGDGDGWRLSRLRWLNSRIAVDDDVCAPFTSITVDGNTVDILGRRIALDQHGMVQQATSFIEMFEIREQGKAVLREPARMEILVGGKVLEREGAAVECTYKSPGLAGFASTFQAGKLTVRVTTTVEMDGFVGHALTLTSDEPVAVDGLRLILPFAEEASRNFMSFSDMSIDQVSPSSRFGETPQAWSYAIERFELLWLGAYNAGLCLRVPPGEQAWINDGRGQVSLSRTDAGRDIVLDTGAMVIKGRAQLNFELYATPFKPLTAANKWNQRHYHDACGRTPDIGKGQKWGANIITYHHGCEPHPYISYPFLVADGLKKCADRIHAGGGLMKAYYTIRELSDRAPELWALRSLGNEILSASDAKPGYPDYHLGYEELSQLPMEYQLRCEWAWPFTGSTWMCEHLVANYHPRWHQPVDMSDRSDVIDASLQVSGMTRWSNFYLEGLRWLMTHAGMDGLYLDGITFDRDAFRRVRKVLVRTKAEGLIDYHSHPTAIGQLPYFDRLWNGEGMDPNGDPAYWLVAVSGVPFGVSGELLMAHASVQRGMVFGLSQRLGWNPDTINPAGLWRWWDAFDIAGADMIGFWQDRCPVKTGSDKVKATAYVHKGKRVAIALASWAPETVTVKLELEWAALGLTPDKVKLSIPEIPSFQAAAKEVKLDAVTIEPAKGWILVLEG